MSNGSESIYQRVSANTIHKSYQQKWKNTENFHLRQIQEIIFVCGIGNGLAHCEMKFDGWQD